MTTIAIMVTTIIITITTTTTTITIRRGRRKLWPRDATPVTVRLALRGCLRPASHARVGSARRADLTLSMRAMSGWAACRRLGAVLAC